MLQKNLIIFIFISIFIISCSKETKKVLVECAYFNPEVIIGKAVKYNLKSDAAHKFERGVDIASQETVLRRFISVVQDHTSIKSLRMNSFFDVKIKLVELKPNITSDPINLEISIISFLLIFIVLFLIK